MKLTVEETEEGEADGVGAAIVLYYKTKNRFGYVCCVKASPLCLREFEGIKEKCEKRGAKIYGVRTRSKLFRRGKI